MNTAHGTSDQHQVRMIESAPRNVARAARWPYWSNLAGPKMRLGEIPGGSIELAVGERVAFIRGLGND